MFLVFLVICFMYYTLGDHYDVPDNDIIGLIVDEEIAGAIGEKVHLKEVMIMVRVHYRTAAGNVAETEKFVLIT